MEEVLGWPLGYDSEPVLFAQQWCDVFWSVLMLSSNLISLVPQEEWMEWTGGWPTFTVGGAPACGTSGRSELDYLPQRATGKS